jgi:hypothetical protein
MLNTDGGHFCDSSNAGPLDCFARCPTTGSSDRRPRHRRKPASLNLIVRHGRQDEAYREICLGRCGCICVPCRGSLGVLVLRRSTKFRCREERVRAGVYSGLRRNRSMSAGLCAAPRPLSVGAELAAWVVSAGILVGPVNGRAAQAPRLAA